MENFITESSVIALLMSLGFFLSALLSFACGASALLFGIVYRNDNIAKSVTFVIIGLAIIFGVAWGINELGWVVPSEISFASVVVVAPSWLTFGIGMIWLVVLGCSRFIKRKFGDHNQA